MATVEQRFFSYTKEELIEKKKQILQSCVSEERSMSSSERSLVASIDRELEQMENKNRKEDKEMDNKEFRSLLKSGKELSDMEYRADSHHVMNVIEGGADYSAQRVETLQQQSSKKWVNNKY